MAKSSGSFSIFRGQLPSAEHGGISRCSGEPVEAVGKLQHRVPGVGIGQLPGHLPRLLCAIKPLEGFIQKWTACWSSLPFSFPDCFCSPFHPGMRSGEPNQSFPRRVRAIMWRTGACRRALVRRPRLLEGSGVGASMWREGTRHSGMVMRSGKADHRIDFADRVYSQHKVVQDRIAARLAAWRITISGCRWLDRHYPSTMRCVCTPKPSTDSRIVSPTLRNIGLGFTP